MGRIDPELLERIDDFSHRVVDVADAIAEQRRSARVVDQIYGCGSGVGANCYESDEAVSRKDFCKGVGWAIKELSECRYWLRFVVRRGWLPESRIAPPQDENRQLKSILGAILSRTRRNDAGHA
ncbi:MAG: four helix bundle protein [Phycisphaerales bacterium]